MNTEKQIKTIIRFPADNISFTAWCYPVKRVGARFPGTGLKTPKWGKQSSRRNGRLSNQIKRCARMIIIHQRVPSVCCWFPWLRLRSENHDQPVSSEATGGNRRAAGSAEIIPCHTSWLPRRPSSPTPAPLLQSSIEYRNAIEQPKQQPKSACNHRLAI